MLILVLDEFPTFTITRLSITPLIFQKCHGPDCANPIAKINNIVETGSTLALKFRKSQLKFTGKI